MNPEQISVYPHLRIGRQEFDLPLNCHNSSGIRIVYLNINRNQIAKCITDKISVLIRLVNRLSLRVLLLDGNSIFVQPVDQSFFSFRGTIANVYHIGEESVVFQLDRIDVMSAVAVDACFGNTVLADDIFVISDIARFPVLFQGLRALRFRAFRVRPYCDLQRFRESSALGKLGQRVGNFIHPLAINSKRMARFCRGRRGRNVNALYFFVQIRVFFRHGEDNLLCPAGKRLLIIDAVGKGAV